MIGVIIILRTRQDDKEEMVYKERYPPPPLYCVNLFVDNQLLAKYINTKPQQQQRTIRNNTTKSSESITSNYEIYIYY